MVNKTAKVVKNNQVYRFFYHFNKRTKRLTVHFKGKCTPVGDIMCFVPTDSKWNKQQPFLVMQGYAKKVIIKDDKAYIE